MKKGASTSIFASWEKASTCIALQKKKITWNHGKIGSRKIIMLSIYTLHVCMHQHIWQRAKEKRINIEGTFETVHEYMIKHTCTTPAKPR